MTNTTDVIDGISATVEPQSRDQVAVDGIGIAGLDVRRQPDLLPLFPDGTGVITLQLTASETFLAGTHHLNVVVRSSVQPDQVVVLPLEVEVPPTPSATLFADPHVQSGRRRATFELTASNTGNVPLDLALAASDPEKAVLSRFKPATLSVDPGETRVAEMTVRVRRHIFGGDIAHPLTMVGTAGPLDVTTRASFRQAPVVPRGVRTIAVLGAIIALWATVFVVAIDKALAKDGPAKEVPPSFYASVSNGATTQTAYSRRGALSLQEAAQQNAVPAGAVPKSGVVIGVGGTVSGTVTAASTGAGVGSITVEAWEDPPYGNQPVASAATASDGSYSLIGLLPGAYKLEFTALGYQNLWYPAAPTQRSGSPVLVEAQTQVSTRSVVITGNPGSISGQVDTGQTPQVPVTVTVLGEQGSSTPIPPVLTDSSGHYTVPNLPAPGSYDLSFSAPGYEVASDSEELAGGQAEIATTITMTAGPGTLGGTVTDGIKPLGGVTITAAGNGKTVTSATPTAGTIGLFRIPNLNTPSTYVLTFSKPGYGTQTLAEHLSPGEQLTNLNVALAGGAGQVSGTVKAPDGKGLGGATVTVSGGKSPVTTETLTAGQVGAYDLAGLATPGRYTLTFSLAGYESETVGVTLGSSGSVNSVNVTLPLFSGGISGVVNSKSGPLSGVAVSVTNGVPPIRTTVSSSSPPGGYSVTGLAPGHWTVTFSLTGYLPVTALVDLQPGQTVSLPVTLTASS